MNIMKPAVTASPEAVRQDVRQPVRNDVLVGPDWLQEHLHDPLLRIVEVDVSSTSFDQGHVDGAVLWNIYRDLKDPDYRLVDRDAFAQLLGRSGIDPGSTVVFYGYAPAMGFWLMRLYGHRDVRILDQARGHWRDQGRPWTIDSAIPPTTSYSLAAEDSGIRADQPTVEAAINDPGVTLVDVRTDLEYRGKRFWPSGGDEPGGRAGHIPSAVRVSIEGVQDESGAFLSPAALRKVFAPIDLSDDRDLITYCTIGGRAATAWFALTYLLGRDHVHVYDGSWAEWGRLPATPVVCS
ncbi:MAG TPA: rhodanese-like domain-containing protein [Kineosporiaceae bacterium]|nr:rhodanese-like domain-containing protein [Kineosporiaceae bacterium]